MFLHFGSRQRIERAEGFIHEAECGGRRPVRGPVPHVAADLRKLVRKPPARIRRLQANGLEPFMTAAEALDARPALRLQHQGHISLHVKCGNNPVS